MSAISKIEWTDATWNPLRGCSRKNDECVNCYAERDGGRWCGAGQPYEGLIRLTTHGPQWTGKVEFVEKHLYDPLRWTRPRLVFVNSVSDLFHESVPDEWIDRIYAVMALTPWHTYQVLTKRWDRMRAYLSQTTGPNNVLTRILRQAQQMPKPNGRAKPESMGWPIRHVWQGVSAGRQRTLDEAVPQLLKTPAAVRFVSCEPLLGPIDLEPYLLRPFRAAPNVTPDVPRIDWVIVGGESGPQARPCNVAWIRSIVRQCKATGVPIFCKQLGSAWAREHGGDRKGGDPFEWPEDLRVREWPRMVRPMEDDAA